MRYKTKTNIRVWLSFFVKDTVGGTFTWTTLITSVSKNETLQEVIVRQDESARDTKKKIMPYLEAEGCNITSIVMKCPLARIPYLGGEEALQCKVATLIEFNESTTLKIEVTVQADLCSISSLQMQKAPRSAPSTKPVDVNQLLMRNQKKIYDFKMKYERNRLPRPKKESHGKFKLWNALLNYCIEHNVKYEKWLGEKERAHSFESIVDVLWKINLASIERGGWKKQPPVELQRFLVFSFHDTNASGTKRKRAPLDENTLNEMYSTLMAVLDSVCFTEESTAMLQFLQGLCESVGQQRNDSIERPEKKLSTRKTFDAAKNVSHSCERAVIPLDQFPTYLIRMLENGRIELPTCPKSGNICGATRNFFNTMYRWTTAGD